MSQHFLLSAKARTLSLASVLRMTDAEAETTFRNLRWPSGKPVCPHCECATVYECRRPNGALRFRCKACRKDFSITSGTLFAHHKMPLQTYLAAVAIFCNEVKGKSALALSRDLDCQYKTAFVLAHKLREAMASELKGRTLGGAGRVAVLCSKRHQYRARQPRENAERRLHRIVQHGRIDVKTLLQRVASGNRRMRHLAGKHHPSLTR